MAAWDPMEADFGGEDDAEGIAASRKELEVEAPTPAVEKTQKKEKKHKKEKKEKMMGEKAGAPEKESRVDLAPQKSCMEKDDSNKAELAPIQTKALETEPEEAAAGCGAVPPQDTPYMETSDVSPETVVREEKPKQEAEADGAEMWQVVEAVVAALEVRSAQEEMVEDVPGMLEKKTVAQEESPKEFAHADGSEDPEALQGVVKAQAATAEEVEPVGPEGVSLVEEEISKKEEDAESSPALEGAEKKEEAFEEEVELGAPQHAELPSEPVEVFVGAPLVEEISEKEEDAESSPALEGAEKKEEATAEEVDLGAPKHAEVPLEPVGVPEGAPLIEEISKKEEEGHVKGEESQPLLACLPEEDVSCSSSSQETWRKFGIPTEASLAAALRGEGPSQMEEVAASDPLFTTPGLPQLDCDYDGDCVPMPTPGSQEEPLPKRVKLEEPDLPETEGVAASSDLPVSTPGLPQLDYDYDGDCAPRPRPKPELQDEPLPKRVKLEQPDLPEITGTPEEVRLLMEAAEPLKAEASLGRDLPYSVEILAPPPTDSGEKPLMIELYGEALLSSHAAPAPLSSMPPWRLCREARRNDVLPPATPSSTAYGDTPMTPYEAVAYEAAPHGLAPETPVQACEVPGVMLPMPSEVATHEQVQAFLSAFQILASLDLPFADKLQVAWMVDNAKYGLVNLADYYDRCLKEVVAESGLTEQHLGALGVPLSVPRFPALPNYQTPWYLEAVYPLGKVKRESLTFEEMRVCVLASELHIGSCQDPTQEGMRAVLQSMPPWYLLKSWVASRMNVPSAASEDLFMGFRGKEAVKVLERNEVEPGIIKVVCASHRDYVETLLDACRITALEWDGILERRLELDSVKLNERWFMEKEDALVNQQGWVRSHRFVLAKAKCPDLYPGMHREIQEAKARGRALCLIPEEQAFNGWHSRPNRGRGGPYSRH
jgi:hypothetical protein